MGYNLHITRRACWLDSGDDIELQEWLDFLDGDPDMRLDGYAECVIASGEILRAEDESLAVWIGYSQQGVGGNHAWFWLYKGRIEAKNPDAEIRRKMFAIAQHFGARVLGDEGEAYGEDDEPIAVADQGGPADSAVSSPSKQRKPWWKRW